MKKTSLLILALITLMAPAIWAQGTVTQTSSLLAPDPSQGKGQTLVVTLSWTGDASDGTVPSTATSDTITANITTGGYYLSFVVTKPGTVSPTSLYDIALNDGYGVDVMAGALADRSATVAEQAFPPVMSRVVSGALNLVITNNAVHSATGSVVLYFNKTLGMGTLSPFASLTMAPGGAFRTGKTAGNTALIQAYDTDTGPAYTTFGTLTAGTTPSFTIGSSTVGILNGAVATPSLLFSTDTDTGLYLKAANTVGIAGSAYISGDLEVAGSSTIDVNETVLGNLAFATGGAIRTGLVAGNTFLLQGYNTSGTPAYNTVATITAANGTPTIAIPTITGDTSVAGAVTVGSTAAGKNLTVNATEGTELITAPMVTGGWTMTDGWSITAGVLSRAGGTTTGTATAVTGMTSAPTSGVTYKVVIVCSAVGGTAVTYTLGGVTGTTITATTVTDYITATNTNKIAFSGGTTATTTITSVSVKPLTDATGDTTVYGNLKLGSPIQNIKGQDVITIGPTGFASFGGATGVMFDTANTAGDLLIYKSSNPSVFAGIRIGSVLSYGPNAGFSSTSIDNSWTTYGGQRLFIINSADYLFQHNSKTTDAATQKITLQGQTAYSSAVTNINGGPIYLQGGTPVGAGLYGHVLLQTAGGSVGIKTTAPDRQVEINSATGANLRLTYNDSDGSAANYADFLTTSGGNLTITPSGGTTTLTASTLGTEATTQTCAGWTYTIATPGWTNCTGTTLTRTALNGNLTATSATVTNGTTYKVVWTLTRSAGTFTMSVGGVSGYARTASGTYTEILTATATTAITLTVDATAAGSVDLTTVSVKPFSAASILDVAASGSASSPALRLTGFPNIGGTATTTKPLFMIEPSGTTSTGWSTAGTLIGANAASGFTGNLLDLQLAGASKFKVDYAGTLTVTDIATATTIGSAYVYRAAGTDIPVTDGGTGVSTLTTAYGLLAAGTTATGNVQTLAAGATTQILVGGGASALPAWGADLPTAVTIGSAYIYRANGTDIPVADGGTNCSAASITCFNNITAFTAAGTTGTTSTNLVFSASPTFTGTVGADVISATGMISGLTQATNYTTGQTLGGVDVKKAVITNSGAAALIHVLPNATVGLTVTFYVVTAAEIKFRPDTGDIINYASATTSQGLKNTTPFPRGDYISVICLVADNWEVVGVNGTWTAYTP